MVLVAFEDAHMLLGATDANSCIFPFASDMQMHFLMVAEHVHTHLHVGLLPQMSTCMLHLLNWCTCMLSLAEDMHMHAA